MRERLRALVGNPQVTRDYYASLIRNGAGNNIEDRYGLAVTQILMKNPKPAILELGALVHEYPKVTQFYGALGQAYLVNNQIEESQEVLEKALFLFPRNVPLTIRMAQTLMRAGDNKRAQLLLDDLFNVVEATPDQTKLIAKAAEAAGDTADADYYMSFYYVMTGDLRMAMNQLQLALGLPGLDPVQRGRISARLEEVRAALPKNRKNTVADENGNGNGRH
jgi:beta-barrel assembly-enhancing protease